MAPVEPHLLQPGAQNEDGSALKFRHLEASGDSDDFSVVDVLSAQRGTYLIVSDNDGDLRIVHQSTVAENYAPVSEPTEDQRENERLRKELDEARGDSKSSDEDDSKSKAKSSGRSSK